MTRSNCHAVATILAVLLFCLVASTASAVSPGEFDDFENGTEGWMDGRSDDPPTTEAGCGSQGSDCLQNISVGGHATGRAQVIFNETQWTGDWIVAGVNTLSAQIANASATQTLHLRMAISNDPDDIDEEVGTCYVTSDPVVLPPGPPGPAGLGFVSFIMHPDTTLLIPDGNLCGGTDSLATVLSNVTHVRLLSAVEPAWRGDSIQSILHLDAVQATYQPFGPLDDANLLLVDGDVVPGLGTVIQTDGFIATGTRDHLLPGLPELFLTPPVAFGTDHPDPLADEALGWISRNAEPVVYLREGDLLSAPQGAVLACPGAIGANQVDGEPDGRLAMILPFYPPAAQRGPPCDLVSRDPDIDSDGIYVDNNLNATGSDAQLLLMDGHLSLATEFTPGTLYKNFRQLAHGALNQVPPNNDIVVLAVVDDPAIPSPADDALVVLTVDPTLTLIAETVLLKEGDVVPGVGIVATLGGIGPYGFIGTGTQDWIVVKPEPPDPSAIVHLSATGLDVLAREGDPTPEGPDRVWASDPGVGFADMARVGGNDAGVNTFIATGTQDHIGIEGDPDFRAVLVRDGVMLARQGDTFPAIAPYPVVTFGDGPLIINDCDDVLTYVEWDDVDQDVNSALVLFGNPDIRLVVREGVSRVNGLVIDTLFGGPKGYTMSDDCTFIGFEAVLADGTMGLFGLSDTDADGLFDSSDNCIELANPDQRDTDGDGIGNFCDADFNNNCSVNFIDLVGFKENFLTLGITEYDMNGDGSINFVDLGLLKPQFLLDYTGTISNPSGVPNLCSDPGYVDIDVMPLSIDFGQVEVGQMSPQFDVIVANDSFFQAGLNILGLTFDGDFMGWIVSDGCSGTTLALFQTCTVGLRFAPTEQRPHTASLAILSDDPNEGVVTVALTGEGTSAE